MSSIRSASVRLLRSSRSFLPKVTSRSLIQCCTSPLWTQRLPSTVYASQHRHFGDAGAPPSNIGGGFNIAPTPKLYVGNLFFEVTGQQLQDLFAPFGAIKQSKIVTDYRGFSKGYGFIEYGSTAEAKKAKEALDQTVFSGRSLVINFVRPLFAAKSPPKPNEPTSTLFVGNLAYNLTDKELNNLFRPLSNIRDVRVAIDRRTGQPRGFAHADFLDVKSATAAQKYLNGLEVSGRTLRADYSISGRNQAMMQYQKGAPVDQPDSADALREGSQTQENVQEEAAVEQNDVAEAETDNEKRL